MTNEQAKKQARKRWGKSFYICNNGKFSGVEKRLTAQTITVESRAEIKRIDEEVKRRLEELDWYQDLQRQRREAAERVKQNEWPSMYYRFQVGRQTAFGFNEILGSGDTWEEAFERAEKKR